MPGRARGNQVRLRPKTTRPTKSGYGTRNFPSPVGSVCFGNELVAEVLVSLLAEGAYDVGIPFLEVSIGRLRKEMCRCGSSWPAPSTRWRHAPVVVCLPDLGRSMLDVKALLAEATTRGPHLRSKSHNHLLDRNPPGNRPFMSFVEPDVFHAPSVKDAVDHQG
jgi:hypothetical protein